MQSEPKRGRPYPLGATLTGEGVNFSLFSSHAKSVELLLFESEQARRASRVVALTPGLHRTGHYWHVELPGLGEGQVYAFRVEGLYSPQTGSYFDRDKVLLDPYGRAVCATMYDREAAKRKGDNEPSSMRNVVVDTSRYDWEGDQPLHLPFAQTVIYEMHVAGFTRDPSSGVAEARRGTYAGLIEKIPYLVDLGITAVELLPVFQFDAQDAPAGLVNYWGYSPVSFFAPHAPYSAAHRRGAGSGCSTLECLDEFRDMVKALHRAGIEVILDVVYNHTAEGNEQGPTFCYKGLDAPLYYMMSADRSRLADFTGTGNTFNVNQSIVRRMIVDSLRYWVSEMHVDGFRFDLASVLTRDETGTPVNNAPVVWDIDSDPVLAGTKLMAEAWDAGGLYQVGTFSKDRWKDWNGRFRDDVRSFIRSDRGSVFHLGQRLVGSPDVYQHRSHPPEQSINFVTCHDGFTLNDLVTYERKHNEANGENNRDGSDGNLSWNCGVEGPTDDPQVEALRERQIRNAFTLTLLSLGTPFLLMGDEVRRTQRGNNNAYCQDNEISWFDWTLCARNAGLLRFVSTLVAIRHNFGSVLGEAQTSSLHELLERATIDWHGVNLGEPDLGDDSHSLAATAYFDDGPACHLMMNAYWEPLVFKVPEPGSTPWFRIIDTSQPSPDDIHDTIGEALTGTTYTVESRSIVLLAALTHRRGQEPPTVKPVH